jgi:hypothetical protein
MLDHIEYQEYKFMLKYVIHSENLYIECFVCLDACFFSLQPNCCRMKSFIFQDVNKLESFKYQVVKLANKKRMTKGAHFKLQKCRSSQKVLVRGIQSKALFQATNVSLVKGLFMSCTTTRRPSPSTGFKKVPSR